jgi:hypothetical protein
MKKLLLFCSYHKRKRLWPVLRLHSSIFLGKLRQIMVIPSQDSLPPGQDSNLGFPDYDTVWMIEHRTGISRQNSHKGHFPTSSPCVSVLGFSNDTVSNSVSSDNTMIRWTINWRGCGRKHSWPDYVTIPELFWRDWGILQKTNKSLSIAGLWDNIWIWDLRNLIVHISPSKY